MGPLNPIRFEIKKQVIATVPARPVCSVPLWAA